MKTSVIRHRVADFLSDYPPFDSFSPEDIMELSGTGRVIFHEDDIYIYRKGQPRDPVLWVIQQGKIEIIDARTEGEHLLDVLGAGDILGLGRFLDASQYLHTAKTAAEVILYSIDAATFETLVRKHPAAGRYLAAHFSVTARYAGALRISESEDAPTNESAGWLETKELPVEFSRRRLITCLPDLSIRDGAKRIFQSSGEALAVVDAEGKPLGLIGAAALGEIAMAGKVPLDTPIEFVMDRRFQTAPAGLKPVDYLIEMMRVRSSVIGVTRSGSVDEKLDGVITDSDLAVFFGRNPVLLIKKILAAETISDLRYLRNRAEALLAEGLARPSTVDYCSQMAAEMITAIVERVIRLSEDEMSRDGVDRPGLSSSAIFFGSMGRREMIAPLMPEFGVVYSDPPPEIEKDAKVYFSTLYRKISANLADCGLQTRRSRSGENTDHLARPLSAWKNFYTGLIKDPIRNTIYAARELFDFQIAGGDQTLALELRNGILAELEGDEAFIPVLANDTLAHLPPLTFFQGLVIELDGTVKTTLDIERTALAPLVDAARVLSFARREISNSNTLNRLQSASSTWPQYTSLMSEAAEGFRVAAYYHAIAPLRKQGEGAIIEPSRLGRYDQRLLKTTFDSIRRLLELTSTIFNPTQNS
jgi:CBS domain-containing protein